jgi:pyruvate/2-oxoglutarate dehydrogenase complex dihydrolipoamide dehydrogenase (E3) component
MVGCEVAEFLATRGKKVTIVEVLPEVANGLEAYTRRLLLERLNKLQVDIITDGSVKGIEGESVFINKKNREKIVIEVDGIVSAQGSEENHLLDPIVRLSGKPFFRVGENIVVGDIATAIQEGFRIGKQI